MNTHLKNGITLLALALLLVSFTKDTWAQATNVTSSSSSAPSTNSPATGDTLGGTILSYQSQEEIGNNIGEKIAREMGCCSGKASTAKKGQRCEISSCLNKSTKNVYITTALQNVGGALIQYQQDMQQLQQLDKKYKETIADTMDQIINPQTTEETSVATNGPAEETSTNVALAAAALAAPEILSNLTQMVSAVTSLVGLVSTTSTLNGVPITANNLGVIPFITDTLHKKHIKSSYVDLFVDTSYVNHEGLFHLLNEDAAHRTTSQTLVNVLLPQPQGPGGSSSNSPAAATIYNNNTVSVYPPTSTTMPAASGANPPTAAVGSSSINFTNLTPTKQKDYIILTSLNSQYDALLVTMMNSNVLSSLLEADFYENNIKDHPTNYLLYISVLYAGGNNLVKSNPVWNIFTDGPRYYYAGGAVAAYILTDSLGNTVVSGVARDLEKYQTVGNSWWYHLPIHRSIQNNLAEP